MEYIRRARTKSELAALYGVTIHVFNEWLKLYEIKKEHPGYYFTPKEIDFIFDRLGIPDKIENYRKV